MSVFVIAYVPTVEQVLNVKNVEVVQTVDVVNEVTNVKNVEVVEEVRKLPHPRFPNKDYNYNYQYGGSIDIGNTTNMYQGVYIPEYDCELKRIMIASTAYNIEDIFDVMIGSRYIIHNSNLKEMAENRGLELFEVVAAGTPITLQYHNNSATSKVIMYDFITVLNNQIINYPDTYNWNFNWSNQAININHNDEVILVISQPDYVNMNSIINTFNLEINDLLIQSNISNISYNGSIITSDYVETDPDYQSFSLLGRSGGIGITDVLVFDKAIHIKFKNIDVNHFPNDLNIGIIGNVINTI